jgi:hypothetical protein
MNPKAVIVAGAVLLIVGVLAGVSGFTSSLKDPGKEAKRTVVFGGVADTERVSLDAGEYDLWYEPSGGLFSMKPVLVITDSAGLPVYTTATFGGSESVSINGKDYHKLGSFKAQSSGDYNFTSTWAATVYVTPPIDIATGLTICFTGVLIGVVGGIAMVIGIYLHFKAKKAREAPPAPQAPPGYPAQYPAQYPGQYQAQYPPGPPGQQPQYPQQQPPQYPPQQPPQYPAQQPPQYPPQQPPQYPAQQPPQYPPPQPSQYPAQQPPQAPAHQPPPPPGPPVPPPPGQYPQ